MQVRHACWTAAGIFLITAAAFAQVGLPPGGPNLPGPGPRGPLPPHDRQREAPPTGTGRILGRVVSAESGAPLRRAQVRLSSGALRVSRTTMTDADGRYAFADLPAGRYSLSVRRSGYVPLQFGQQRPFESGRPLFLADGQVAERIDFALPRGSVISGRITDETGEPLPDVGVRAMRYQYQPDGTRQLTSAVVTGRSGVHTDDRGEFRVYGLMPGTYILAASASHIGMSTGGPAGNSSHGSSEGFSTTYYPGTRSEAEAHPITVGIGEEASAYFAMIPTRLSRISGMIRDSQGRPATNVMLSLRTYQRGGGMVFGFGGGMTAPDGTFSIANVPPGDYHIEVRPNERMRGMGDGAAADEFASVPLTVSGEDITDLLITTGHGASVSGRVVAEGESLQAAIQNARARMPARVVFAGTDNRGSSMMTRGFENGRIEADGRFELKGLLGAGTFRLSGVSRPIKSITVGGVDITDRPFEVKPGAATSDVVITITSRLTSVSGGVRTAAGQTPADYVAVFFPAYLPDGTQPTRFVRIARPDADGRYTVRGLPPAEYFAAAVESLENGRQWDPAFQAQIKPRAERVSLGEGQTLSVDLPLVRTW